MHRSLPTTLVAPTLMHLSPTCPSKIQAASTASSRQVQQQQHPLSTFLTLCTPAQSRTLSTMSI